MSASHTPGPWVINREQEEILYGKLSVEDKSGYFIAQVDEGQNQEANARLIAAAPTMLAALQAVLADCWDGDTDSCLELEVGKQLRAAIDLATGEKS
jgi:hypothetical protein